MNSETCPVAGVHFRTIRSNGIDMRLAVAGEQGPLLLLLHGWPESWYNWRHQLQYFAAKGYRVVAPDMRGYGGSAAPPEVEAYDIQTLVADVTGIVDALGEDRAFLVGHDWGAIVAWHAALLAPQRFHALIAMSVPYTGRPAVSPIASFKQQFGDRFFYILYHNARDGRAEQEYDAAPRQLLSRLYLSPDSPRDAPDISDSHYRAGGWIGRLGAARALPDWLRREDLDYLEGEFRRSGFRGGLNYYRNFQRNWELAADFGDERIRLPTLFLAGAADMVIGGADAARLRRAMAAVVPALEDVKLFPGIGHWLQQEAPQACNEAMAQFLSAQPASA